MKANLEFCLPQGPLNLGAKERVAVKGEDLLQMAKIHGTEDPGNGQAPCKR